MLREVIKNKKGDITTKQLVTIIILIVSFIIILFLIFRLNLGETTDKEICRNSVALKGQSKILAGPLDCKTNYLCISGGGDCEGISPKETVKINMNQDNVKIKNDTMKAFAEEMADCWWQFGEGKVNYGGGETATSVHYAICSIISFDEKVQGKVSEISYSEFYTFLSTEKKSDTDTYLQYLYGINDVGSFTPQEQIKINISQDKILIGEKYSVITGIDNNLGDDEILKVYIIPTSETQERTIKASIFGSKEFVTKV